MSLLYAERVFVLRDLLVELNNLFSAFGLWQHDHVDMGRHCAAKIGKAIVVQGIDPHRGDFASCTPFRNQSNAQWLRVRAQCGRREIFQFLNQNITRAVCGVVQGLLVAALNK
jgi:hypothetical protein